jgi:hypothetical protein
MNNYEVYFYLSTKKGPNLPKIFYTNYTHSKVLQIKWLWFSLVLTKELLN